jgi:hypothetical protein
MCKNFHVAEWLTKHTHKDARFTTEEEIDILVKNNLRMRVKERNVHLRVLSLFSDYNKLLKDNGLKWLLTKDPKEFVQHVLSAARPAELQKRVREDLSFSKQDLKSDMKEFYKHLATQAEHYEDFIPAASKTPTRSGAAGSEGSGISGTKTTVNHLTWGGTSGKSSNKSGPDRIRATSLAATCGEPDKQKEKPLCLNSSVCKERHFLKDCPITSDADKDELFAKNRAEQVTAGGARQTRSTTKAGYINSKRVGANTDEILADKMSTPEGRFMVTFPCGYTSLCLPDNGSDYNILPRSVLDAHGKAGPFVKTLRQDPVELSLAVQVPGLKVQYTLRLERSVNFKSLYSKTVPCMTTYGSVQPYPQDSTRSTRPALQETNWPNGVS